MILAPFILRLSIVWLEKPGTTSHDLRSWLFVKFYPKGRLTWWFFVVFFDLESWCYSAEVGVASLFCKSPFAFLDKQDARIVALYRGVSQKVGFGSTALLNLQKLVGSVQSERCKRCFAKSLESATVWKCCFVHSHLCSFLGFDWNAPMLRVPPESSAPNGQALHWIYGVPQDSNEVSTSVGINKKKANGCQRWDEDVQEWCLCSICYFIYIVCGYTFIFS